MSYENIRLRKSNFTVVDGYFYMMDDNVDSLIVKTDDGTQAFSYPLSDTITNEITSLEHDGRNFWSLETSATNQVTIKKWYINNYICTLRDTFPLGPGGSHNYVSSAFTVEHYHTTFADDELAGLSALVVDDATGMDTDHVITLGPNDFNQLEEVVISSVVGNTINIVGTTTYDYAIGDPISSYANIWLFNNYDGTTPSVGALYEINARTGAYVTHSGSASYYGVNSCTFYDVSSVDPSWGNAICYVKGTSMLFVNPNDIGNNFGAMVMDNIKTNQTDTIDIHDIAMYGTNVYRLQTGATYYAVDITWSSYNYQLSTLESFVTSISLRAAPAILPANGVNVSTITAVVKDQFLIPVSGRVVTFTEDDPVGTMTSSSPSTNGDGVAITGYNAGTSAREVTITATVQQT